MELTIKPDYERIELQQQGSHVLVNIWCKGWRKGSAAHVTDYLVDTSLDRTLMKLEDAGFTCTVHRDGNANALRGEITRVDFLKMDDGSFVIAKYPRGWTAAT